MSQRERGDATTTPHDALVKRTFSKREHAAGLLAAALAPEIVEVLHWDTLTQENGQSVDRALRGRYVDLLFSVQMGEGRVYAYVLIEHQRKVEPLMIFRMGSYMWRLWEQLLRDDPSRERLPAIIPVLIHNSSTGWTAATSFEDIIATPEGARDALLTFIPRFAVKLVDLGRGAEGGLTGHALTDVGRLVLWALSVADHDKEQIEAELEQLVLELNTLYSDPASLDALLSLLEYLVATHPTVPAAEMANLLENTARKGPKEINMDVLDVLKREGRREGREEGFREGRAEGERAGRAHTLLDLLAARFGAVPAKAKAKILAADEKTLSRWSIQVLTAPTLAAALDDAPAPRAKRTSKPTAQKRARTAR